MAFPKNSGLRQIVVDDVVYRWRFLGEELRGALAIYGPNSGGRALIVNSYEWFDVWLSSPFSLRKAPEIVTPAIVRCAIEFALRNGWNPNSRGVSVTFWYCDSEFQVNEPDEKTVDAWRQTQFNET